jgi:hypothetical protein
LPKGVRPSTATAYAAHVVNVLRPALGHHRLGALTRAHVQAMFDELTEHTNRYDMRITASTVQRVRATLRRALNAAAAHGYRSDAKVSLASRKAGAIGRTVISALAARSRAAVPFAAG